MRKNLLAVAFFLVFYPHLFPVPSYGDVLPNAGTNSKTQDSIYLEVGPAASQAVSGFQFGGGYGLGLDRNLYLVLSTQYYTSTQNYSTSNQTNSGTVAAGLDVWTVLANLRVNFTDRDNPVVFYGIAGCGPGLLMRSASAYFYPANVLEPMSRLGIGIDVRFFKRVFLSLEEGFVYQFAVFPFLPDLAGNGLGSANYPPVSIGLNFEPF